MAKKVLAIIVAGGGVKGFYYLHTGVNGVWPPLQHASVAHKNKLSTMLSSNVPSIDLMDCTAWRFWMMRQSNGCSAPAPRSIAA